MKRMLYYMLILLLGASGPISGQELQKGTVKGIWKSQGEKDDPSFRWQAHWIWLPEGEDSFVMLARRNIRVEEEPESALLRITASDRYQLYINGKYICMGPARSAAHHQSYDILDVSDVLENGKNTIAVRVHAQEGKQWYQYPGRGGLLVQLELNNSGKTEVIASNNSWKVSRDHSWSNDAPRINRFQDAVNDRVDFRKYVRNWESGDFDDNDWVSARELHRNSGWPAVQRNAEAVTFTVPWTGLVPRDLPYLEEKDIRADHLLAYTEIEDPGLGENIIDINALPIEKAEHKSLKSLRRSLKIGSSISVPACKKGLVRILIFDFGEVVIGMPKLELAGEKGGIIDVMCAPYILDNSFTHKIVDSDCLDRIVLSGEKDSWMSTYFKPGRYMAIALRGTSEELVIHYAGMHRKEYPFKSRAKIEAPGDSWIPVYWEASKKTLRVCTTDGYTDNYRERRQYAQTGYYAALGNYWTFGDHALQRRYLIQVAQEQKANGIMPAYAPLSGSDYMVIFDSNCLWVRSLKNYLLYSGDYETVKDLLPAALRLMELMHSYTDKNALLSDPPYAYWLDHASLDRRGANFTLNGHYLGALVDFAEILEWIGDRRSSEYDRRAQDLREAMQLMWDPARGLFADALIKGERSESFSEHSNAMALALKIASKEQALSITSEILAKDEHNYILRESGLVMVTPAMSYFLHKGLCEYGFVEESFDLFRSRFDRMLADGGNGTLWEEWLVDGTGRTGKLQKKTRSDAQTESAFPPALFAEYLFGIEVLSPGMKEIRIRPVFSGVRELSGEFPLPGGNLSLAWRFTGNGGGSLHVVIPADLDVHIDLSVLEDLLDRKIVLNEKALEVKDEADAEIKLGEGRYELRF